jgi:hypothetical protein
MPKISRGLGAERHDQKIALRFSPDMLARLAGG